LRLSTLRQAEGACVDDSVCPGVAEAFEILCEVAHGTTTIQLEHERNVLQDQPVEPLPLIFREAKHLRHET
jgi:hypothetical protein